jgi:hypothetical protein
MNSDGFLTTCATSEANFDNINIIFASMGLANHGYIHWTRLRRNMQLKCKDFSLSRKYDESDAI